MSGFFMREKNNNTPPEHRKKTSRKTMSDTNQTTDETTNNRDNQFESAFGHVILERYPLQKRTPMRAWNAADELALAHLKEHIKPEKHHRILTINDNCGALALPLLNLVVNTHVTSWSDSVSSQKAIERNTERNFQQIITRDGQQKVPTLIPSTQEPEGFFDVVIIQIPKTLSLLEYQLRTLRDHLTNHSIIIGCGMVKHLQHSFTELFEQLVGPTVTSLAKKKARLILPTFNPDLALAPAPKTNQYSLEEWPLTLTNLSNVFAQSKLDIGTRFFLPNLGADQQHVRTIFDLGCGNGALGIAASQTNKEAHILFCDDSYLAVKSAEQSFHDNSISNPASFKAMDCLSDEQRKADLILCNPPFHQNNTVGTHIALRMFQQAQQHLTEQGELRVVGNRHLDYRIPLKRLFKTVNILDSNKKFSIYQALN